MAIKTFRAKSIQQALAMVRQELGPDASVLHTRRLNTGLVARLMRGAEVEVAATVATPQAEASAGTQRPVASRAVAPDAPAVEADQSVGFDHRERFRDAALEADAGVPLASQPIVHNAGATSGATALFDAFTQLIEADIDEPVCHTLIDELRRSSPEARFACPGYVSGRLAELVAGRLRVGGPIAASPHESAAGARPHVAALVGPTGVGKTTTIAKLAANFRLREHKRVGLVTVDTYRVAAVEQLRTYADLIDLPMEVVSTPREMRQAIERMAGLDLVLMDTAGRSPRDAAKVQELKSILAEAGADEVHLVLSTTAGSRSLVRSAERFAGVGVTSLLLTKLDEAPSLGAVLSLAGATDTPIGYMTDGQNVPDDIAVADSHTLAGTILRRTAHEAAA